MTHDSLYNGHCGCGHPCPTQLHWEHHRYNERRIQLIEADVRAFGGPTFTRLEDLEKIAFPRNPSSTADAA